MIEEANTGPVTINGKPLLSNTGNPLVAGALAADGIYLFLDNGDSYRLLSDYVSASIVAAAEAAAMAASEAAGDAVDVAERAETAAASVEFPVSYAPQTLTETQRAQARANLAISEFASLAEVRLRNIPAPVAYIRTAGYSNAGDGGAALCRRRGEFDRNVARNPGCDDPSVWRLGDVGLGTWAVNDGLEVVSPPLATTARVYQNIFLTAGHTYKLVYTISGLTSGQLRSLLYTGSTPFFYPAVLREANGTYEEVFTAPSGVVELGFRVGGTTVNSGARIDNVYLYKEASAEDLDSVQSADGSWWVLVEPVVTPARFGAVGDGIADDTAALQAAVDDGRPLDFGSGRYRVTSSVSTTLVNDLFWSASGAVIVSDASPALEHVIRVETARFNVEVQSPCSCRAAGV